VAIMWPSFGQPNNPDNGFLCLPPVGLVSSSTSQILPYNVKRFIGKVLYIRIFVLELLDLLIQFEGLASIRGQTAKEMLERLYNMMLPCQRSALLCPKLINTLKFLGAFLFQGDKTRRDAHVFELNFTMLLISN